MSDETEPSPMPEDARVARTGVKGYFNPFAFSIEENNEFLRRGYEPMPMRVPDPSATRAERRDRR